MKGIDAPVGMNRENRYFVNKIFIPLEVFMKAREIKTFSMYSRF